MSFFYLQFEKALKPLDDMIHSLESKGEIYQKKKFNLWMKKARKKKTLWKIFF